MANPWLMPHSGLDGSPLIDHLFARFAALYGNRWTAQFKNDQAIELWRQTWADALFQEGIRPEEIRTAMETVRKQHEWPPTLPEFIRICRPPTDYEVLFRYAANEYARRFYGGGDDWPSPAVFWAAARVGRDMIERTWEDLKARWKTELDRALAEERAGTLPEIPPAREALPAPGQTYTPDRVAEIRARINELTSRAPDHERTVKEGAKWPVAFGTGQKVKEPEAEYGHV